MADITNSGYNGDATNGIGQGLAFVLPENRAATYAMQLAQTHATQLQQIAKAKQVAQQKSQLQYQSDFKSQELPKAFAPLDKQLNDKQNKWMQDGAKYYAETGKNPYNDPEFVARHNSEVIVPAAKSNEFGTEITKRIGLMQADKTGAYSEDSKKQLNDFYQGFLNSDDKIGYVDKPIPELKDRDLSSDDLIKTLKQSGDPSYNNAQVFAAATGDPKYKPLLAKYGYNSDLPDFGVYTDPSHPNGKRVWYTNPTFTGHQADLILDAPNDAKNAATLNALGIHPEDQYAKEKLQHAISDQNAAMGKFVSENGARLNDPEKAQQLKDQAHTIRNQDREYNLHVEEHNDLQKERKQKFDAIPPFEKASSNLQQSAQSGDNEAAKTYLKGLVEHIPTKGLKEPITSDVQNGQLVINIPRKSTGSLGGSVKAHQVKVDVSDPNFGSVLWAKLKAEGMDVNAFNQAYKGRNVPESKSNAKTIIDQNKIKDLPKLY